MLFHPLLFLIEIISFRLGKRNFSSKYLISSHLLLGGWLSSFLSKFLGYKLVDFEKNNSLLNLASNFNMGELKKVGFQLSPSAISQEIVNEILEVSLKTHGSNRGMDSGKGYEENIFFNRHNPKTVRFDCEPNAIFRNHTIQNLTCDPMVLSIAQEYLGTLPVLDFVAMWWHVKSDRPDKEAAQYFHFDMERLRWIKFFFYITEVTENSGPHIFVPNSHTDFGLPFKLRSKGYARLTDDEVSAVFPADNWKEFVGPVGSMIVEDTRGLHKGKHVKEGDRLVFQIQYTNCLFGKQIPKINISKSDLSPFLEKSMNSYPKIFQQINLV
jgi:hypothetical protein